MKITIEFDPGELVKAAASQAAVAPASETQAARATEDAPVDGGQAPELAGTASEMGEVPAELAAQAATIGAISAGPAPEIQ